MLTDLPDELVRHHLAADGSDGDMARVLRLTCRRYQALFADVHGPVRPDWSGVWFGMYRNLVAAPLYRRAGCLGRFEGALRAGHVDNFHHLWATPRLDRRRTLHRLRFFVFRYASLSTIRHMDEVTTEAQRHASSVAVVSQDRDVVWWLLSFALPCEIIHCVIAAAHRGDLALIRWLFTQPGVALHWRAVQITHAIPLLRSVPVAVVVWLLGARGYDMTDAIHTAAKSGNLPLVQYLVGRDTVNPHPNAGVMALCCWSGNVALMEWYNGPLTRFCVPWAHRSPYAPDAVAWLRARGCPE